MARSTTKAAFVFADADEEGTDLPLQAWNDGPQFTHLKIPERGFTDKKMNGGHTCTRCGRSYKRKDSLQRHVQWECGVEPQFQCPYCPQRCKRKTHWQRHIQRQHVDKHEEFQQHLISEKIALMKNSLLRSRKD